MSASPQMPWSRDFLKCVRRYPLLNDNASHPLLWRYDVFLLFESAYKTWSHVTLYEFVLSTSEPFGNFLIFQQLIVYLLNVLINHFRQKAGKMYCLFNHIFAFTDFFFPSFCSSQPSCLGIRAGFNLLLNTLHVKCECVAFFFFLRTCKIHKSLSGDNCDGSPVQAF